MTASKDQLNVKKIVLVIAVVTGVVVLALATYRDATRQHLPVPLQTPLPDQNDSAESEPSGDAEPALDVAEPAEGESLNQEKKDSRELESEDTAGSLSLDVDADEEINADADK